MVDHAVFGRNVQIVREPVPEVEFLSVLPGKDQIIRGKVLTVAAGRRH
jgi:hypothetical protein